MHLYTLVSAPFVALLLNTTNLSSADVKAKSSFIQAAFLLGWALGGGIFGRLGDVLGRARALSLTILTYAIFTGLSCFATHWWEMLIYRFVAALGIGGEWAVGSALLAETWPKNWRAWIAAFLQSGVNLGVLLACGAWAIMVKAMSHLPSSYSFRGVFLIGILPALLVYWIRRNVPEPDEWHLARVAAGSETPGVSDLFRGQVRWLTIRTILVCSCSLTGWWALQFWQVQHLRNLPELASWTSPQREWLVTLSVFVINGTAIPGNFFAGWLARRIGYRNALVVLFVAFFAVTCAAFGVERGHVAFLMFIALIGFCAGVFGLFTMYLPPLFPTLLRTTGAGFCYNIGRVVAAFGTVFFGMFAKVGDFRLALLYDGLLFIPAALFALTMPQLRDGDQ
jgi:MFS family permease